MTSDWPMKLNPGTFSGALLPEVAQLKDECLPLPVTSLPSLGRVSAKECLT